MDAQDVFIKSFRSGLSGAGAMTVSVSTLMWMRTIMNYQYRHGGKLSEVASRLHSEGGIRRFYRGYGVAIFQGPLSRFGDTFSNTMALTLLEKHPEIPLPIKTGVASVAAGLFRILLMPIDTLKTSMQVEGDRALRNLKKKSVSHGPGVFFHGAVALSTATMAGHYPWFATYNYLDARAPQYETNPWKKHSRNAAIGFTASIVSDSVSNCFRVIKTVKQTHSDRLTYSEVVRLVKDRDGMRGLFVRGLGIRLLTNGIQGLLFTVVWKSLMAPPLKN